LIERFIFYHQAFLLSAGNVLLKCLLLVDVRNNLYNSDQMVKGVRL
jgi:hypothetical protein